MTKSATERFLASFCLTMLVGAAASANPTGDRLFVLVSPPHVDGESDVVLHFRTEASGIECGDTTAELTGLTFDGREFAGSDAIDVLGCGMLLSLWNLSRGGRSP